jgi:hypothetical protein
MLIEFISMIAALQSNDSAVKVTSIAVAVIFAGYALYSVVPPKSPFDHLPRSTYDQLPSYIYDPSRRDEEIYEKYPPFEKIMMAGVPSLLVNDPDIAHQVLLRQDRYRQGHLFGRSPFQSFFHTVLIGGNKVAIEKMGYDYMVNSFIVLF